MAETAIAIEERVSYLEGWRDGIKPRLDRIEERIEQLAGRIDRLDERLSGQINDLRRVMFQLFLGDFGFLALLMTIFKLVGYKNKSLEQCFIIRTYYSA